MGIPIFLLVAYTVFWTLTFVLVLTMWARQRRLEKEIAALEAQIGERVQSAE